MNPKKELTPEVSAEIVRHILTTRDFCGNECEVMLEFKQEYNISEKQEFEIVQAVEAEWNKWRIAARIGARRS